jgi:hypothetical protein
MQSLSFKIDKLASKAHLRAYPPIGNRQKNFATPETAHVRRGDARFFHSFLTGLALFGKQF